MNFPRLRFPHKYPSNGQNATKDKLGTQDNTKKVALLDVPFLHKYHIFYPLR